MLFIIMVCLIAGSTAEDGCRRNNSTLAVFETREEWEEVGKSLVMMGNGRAWIRGKAITNRSIEFQWGDGTKIETRKNEKFGWWESQPRGGRNCVATGMDTTTGKFGWYADQCLQMSAFLCEFNKTAAETSSLN
jgi:hypothetical protein